VNYPFKGSKLAGPKVMKDIVKIVRVTQFLNLKFIKRREYFLSAKNKQTKITLTLFRNI